MNNNEIKKMLADVDAALDKISVKGGDVFAMAEARRILKHAYDTLKSEDKEVKNG